VGLGVVLLVATLLAAAGCERRSPLRIRPGPVVQEQRLALSRDALQRVAVIPFYPGEQLRAPPATPPSAADAPPFISGWEAASLVAGFMAEALAAAGIPTVPPNDVEVAFVGEGHPVPRLDPRAAGALTARDFGATSVLLGKVLRYREREGSAAGATRPASVAFEVSLHDTATGRRLWTGRFDETQQPLTENVFRARQYPGGGTRWLTAAELGRWGASQVAKSLRAGP
jgi:hypothetical protein